jgi:cell division protein FtsI/penicillin-binding protein 2
LERSGLSIVEQEARGQIYTRDPQGRWGPQKVATVSYGKGIQVTALALARAYCPIVNGGDLPRLRLIKRLIDRRGQTVVEIPGEVERGVLHPQTAAEVRKMLHRVVWESPGTGRPARSSLYETAGKTGTSVGYHREDPRIVSFLGFAPYQRPRIICSVLVANPRRGSRTGAGTCGPAFRSIVERTLDYLGVPPDTERLAHLFPASRG